MNLPTLIQHLYGVFTFTGLFSFEFVDKSRNTITEIFFFTPPKNKTVSEPTRSAVVPTLGGNYNIDGGNATKKINLSGQLYFPYIGSPDNPVARENAGLPNPLSGMEEFLKLRWMLIRYRDYTMTSNARVSTPVTLTSVSPQIAQLYKVVSGKIKNKVGALSDEIRLIFHDYDMDDHFYARIASFSSSQSDQKHIAIEYTIEIECYEPDDFQKNTDMRVSVKPTTNESVDTINTMLQQIDFETLSVDIQSEIGYNYAFLNTISEINNYIELIDAENTLIQSGQSTASENLPLYVTTLLTHIANAETEFLNTFLSPAQKILYDSGDATIDDIVDVDLLSFYNAVQKIKIQAQSLQGVLNSIVVIDEFRYYADADDYTLSEEQFSSDNTGKTENVSAFFYYTVMQGDSARVLAQRFYHDQEQFPRILNFNSITENDLIDETFIGKQIKIPFPVTAIGRGADNLVFEADFSDLNKFMFGTEFALDLNNNFIISGKGDLQLQTGVDNVIANIENRIKNRKGSLNVMNPNWGTVAVDEDATPMPVKINRYLTDVITQIQADPRVESAQMQLDKLQWDGETLSVPVKIFFVNTDQTREVTV
ncbi:MAG: hypothetical protein PHG61_08350 [Candidatus Marinimicrobia bacterium]|nr:hypothetical protein [Candidatus Neomarinimicrobiota bacterium]